ncbi:MAG: hypothetical protein V1915_01175 [Candidatus Bathyarchaeota archaeon]
MDEYIQTTHYLSIYAETSGECIKLLGLNPALVTKIAQKVDELEEKVDEEYVCIQPLLLKYSRRWMLHSSFG